MGTYERRIRKYKTCIGNLLECIGDVMHRHICTYMHKYKTRMEKAMTLKGKRINDIGQYRKMYWEM